MGREARRTQAAVAEQTDYGDAVRIVEARAAFVSVLGHDLRIVEHYRRWLDGRQLPQLTAAARRYPHEPFISRQTHALTHTPDDAERAALDLVLAGMGVPPAWPWVRTGLFAQFRIAAFNDVHPDQPQDLELVAGGLSHLAAGRRPRHGGRDVAAWVTWFYRTRIKHPRDTAYAIGKEYAERENRLNRADSVVEDGIVRAENLLSRTIER